MEDFKIQSELKSDQNVINVHKFSQNPALAFLEILPKKETIPKLPLDTPISANKVRVVCLSDTHVDTRSMSAIPKADLLIHAGDFLKSGTKGELREFCNFLSNQNHIKYKVVIAGNHDGLIHSADQKESLKKQCIYLEDSYVKLFGLNIYGSPWQPVHCDNAFQLKRGKELLDKWNKIPEFTDILITHGPPLGYGDKAGGVKHVGCVELLNTVLHRVKPKFHVFGHIHEDYGIWTNGTTTFINASICNRNYNAVHQPIIFDIEISPNKSKDDFLPEF
ncbi:unnamed protein product [Brachionus calyciflorus]|uniref:Calcineurin-like phosphoesterase domain-containing protein n=1 Tax=Brachionus calyciflorus TaxID=104777 RepID=A0A813WRJ0_9BILA|nr:unnamed protein product [Brachionus calyciflorus]